MGPVLKTHCISIAAPAPTQNTARFIYNNVLGFCLVLVTVLIGWQAVKKKNENLAREDSKPVEPLASVTNILRETLQSVSQTNQNTEISKSQSKTHKPAGILAENSNIPREKLEQITRELERLTAENSQLHKNIKDTADKPN